MAKYLVLYTIHNDENSLIRDEFVRKLEEIGLTKFDDESSNYGSYDGTLDGLTILLRKLRFDLLNGGDKVTLFHATKETQDNYTIEKIEI